MTQQSFNPGMKEIGDIVAGLYKDVKLLKECSWLGGAQKYASKRKGWTAAQEDILGPRGVPDGVDEILIRDKKGNIRVINGYTLVPSKHAERQAYLSDVPRWDDAALDAAEIMEPNRRRARKGRPMEPMKQYMTNELYHYIPQHDDKGDATGQWVLAPNANIKSSAADYLRKQSSPHPRKIFRMMIKPIWDQVKNEFPPNTPTDVKLRVYGIWFTNEYINHVINPVLQYMHINPNSIPDKKALTHITSSPSFKYNALRYLATEVPQQRTLNEDIAKDLHTFIAQASREFGPDNTVGNEIQESEFME